MGAEASSEGRLVGVVQIGHEADTKRWPLPADKEGGPGQQRGDGEQQRPVPREGAPSQADHRFRSDPLIRQAANLTRRPVSGATAASSSTSVAYGCLRCARRRRTLSIPSVPRKHPSPR